MTKLAFGNRPKFKRGDKIWWQFYKRQQEGVIHSSAIVKQKKGQVVYRYDVRYFPGGVYNVRDEDGIWKQRSVNEDEAFFVDEFRELLWKAAKAEPGAEI